MNLRSFAFSLLVWLAFVPGVAAAAYGPGLQAESYPQVIPSQSFSELARMKLEETLAAQGEKRRHELKLMREPPSMRCPPGEITSEVTIRPNFRYGTTIPISINTYVDGKFFRRATCYYRVIVYDRVLVAAHDLALEQVITAGDVRVEEREIDDRGVKYLFDLKDVVGQVPARMIRSGTPLTSRMIQTPIVMEVGSPIMLIAVHNGIEVRTEGVAMQRGRIGKIIKVRNTRSSKALRGKVIDATTVEIL